MMHPDEKSFTDLVDHARRLGVEEPKIKPMIEGVRTIREDVQERYMTEMEKQETIATSCRLYSELLRALIIPLDHVTSSDLMHWETQGKISKHRYAHVQACSGCQASLLTKRLPRQGDDPVLSTENVSRWHDAGQMAATLFSAR